MTQTQDHAPATIPVVQPQPRTVFDRWCWDHGLDDVAAGALFGCSKQMIGHMRRHFSDPRFKPPGRDLLTRIVRKTNGGVRPGDFSPPVEDILAGRAAA